MLSYVLRRFLLVFPTLIGMTALIFFVMATSPGGAAADLVEQEGQMRPEERRRMIEYLNQRYGLNQPLLVQYFRWLNKVSPVGFRTWRPGDAEVVESRKKEAQVKAAKEAELKAAGAESATIEKALGKIEVSPAPGDFRFNKPAVKVPDLGESFRIRRSVGALVRESLPITVLLNVMSIPVVYGVAIIIGIQAARHRGKVVDVASGTFLLALWSLPVILAGVLLQGFLTSREYVQLFPTTGLHDLNAEAMTFLPRWGPQGWERGWLLDSMWHLVLPVVCLSYGGFAFLAKLMRGSVLETISSDFVRTARAKGVGERVVLYVHVFRNSLLPLITMAARILPGLLAGSVIVETIFGIPGMGSLLVKGVQTRDRELVLSISMISGVLGLLSYLLADIGYAIADPRVSYE